MMWQMPLKVNRTRHFPCPMTYHCYPVDLQKKNINNPGIFSEIRILDKKFILVLVFSTLILLFSIFHFLLYSVAFQ